MIANRVPSEIVVCIGVFAIVCATLSFVSLGSGRPTLSKEEFSPASIDKTLKDISPMESVKFDLMDAHKKLSTDLLQLLDDRYLPPGGEKEALKLEMRNLKQLRRGPTDDLVYVYVYLKKPVKPQIIKPYVWEVTNIDEENHLAVAWVEVKKLESLASLSAVRTIRTVMPPLVRTGSVTTEGDTIHRTSEVRTIYAQRGAGVKVGIISDGVDHLADAQSSGDLPATVTVLSNAVGGDEGTAMLEIVHDMVPDAELYFHDRGNNILDFNTAIDDLVAAGCDIICDDIGWLLEPFFEDGIVASHVQSVLDGNDIIYVSSAGNAAHEHYQGDYYPIPGTTQHNFSHGMDEFQGYYLYLYISAGSNVRIVLQWNDQFGSSGNDYNLYLYSYKIGNVVAQSTATQNGDDDPLEWVSYTANAATKGDFAIIVDNKNGLAATKTLEVYIYPDYGAAVYTNNIVPSDSIFGHPAVPDAIAVGAIDASDPDNDEIEFFSSQGPVTITYPTPETRAKPDLCGVDGVTVTGAGGFPSPFYGTSASAPHIAAIAAQLWGTIPSATPSEIRSCLSSASVDLGVPGFDYVFGSGRADAFEGYNCIYPLGIADHVVISELYADAVNEGDSEWLELYNPTGLEIDISGWVIDTTAYRPDVTLPPGARISAHGFYLIGDAGWAPDNSTWPIPDYAGEEITLTNTNGWIQLKNSTGAVIDTVGWGSATMNETAAYPDNPPPTKSLQRKVNATITEDGIHGPAWDSDNNSADFFVRDSPNPQNSNFGPLPPIPELPSLILLAAGLTVVAAGIVMRGKRS
ncbi:MAG: hypothetical protein EFT35_09960 [Methanophagales archaeon ANME-1-THS]|nr:MAG: hypothetical protein EFT35_09960 [Methanophagales archaeon ANME-1-THS]